VFLSSFTFIVGCAPAYNPARGEQQWIIFDREEEIAIGQRAAEEVRTKFEICEERSQYLARIGRKVAFASSNIALPYSFEVIKEEKMNALALPGGPVFMTSGLFDELDDDELAVVLGHEIAHITARHGVERLQAHQLRQALLVGAIVSGGEVSRMAHFASTALLIVTMGYSQEEELWTDRQGAKYAHRAGFDPWAKVRVLEMLREEERQKGLSRGWLSTHPPTAERIKSIREYLDSSEFNL
jgi:predicted Zn-dependent protease